MDSKMVVEILRGINAYQVQEHSRNVQCCCFMSPYRKSHRYGQDKRPSMGISINSTGVSLVHCLSCGYSASLVVALKDLEEKSGKDLSEIILRAQSFEKLDPEALVLSIKLHDEKDTAEVIVDESELEAYPKGFHPNILSRGLTLETLKAWDSRWDSEFKRVMFPVRNFKHELVGAVGRTMINSQVKYYNYFHFDKSKYLFGENMALRNRPVVLVEGQIDTILLWQYFKESGVNADVVALAGSSPSKKQLQKVARNWDSVVLFLDNDFVGWEGTKVIARELQNKVVLKVISYPPEGGDPADLVKAGFNIKALYDSATLTIVRSSR